MPTQTTIQLTTGHFILTGHNLTGAFIQRVIQPTTAHFSHTFYDAIMDAFPIPEVPTTAPPSAIPDESSGPRDISGRSPSWRTPGGATGGTAWRTPDTTGGPWRRG